MADAPINNIDELRAEIARLRLVKEAQGKALARRFDTPLTTLSTLYTIFPNKGDGEKSGFFQQDFVSLLSRIFLPITLNKTIFRNSGFLVKTLVSLLSQKASQFINEDTITGVWEKIMLLFEKKHEHADYGIPPESEASRGSSALSFRILYR